MATMLAESGHDVRVYCETLAPVDLGDVLGRRPRRHLLDDGHRSRPPTALADLLGTAGVPVVLGGPHVSFRADEALGHAPLRRAGRGPADDRASWWSRLEEGRPLDEVRGLSFRATNGEFHHNPARPRCTQEEFERLPIPDLASSRGTSAG